MPINFFRFKVFFTHLPPLLRPPPLRLHVLQPPPEDGGLRGGDLRGGGRRRRPRGRSGLGEIRAKLVDFGLFSKKKYFAWESEVSRGIFFYLHFREVPLQLPLPLLARSQKGILLAKEGLGLLENIDIIKIVGNECVCTCANIACPPPRCPPASRRRPSPAPSTTSLEAR